MTASHTLWSRMGAITDGYSTMTLQSFVGAMFEYADRSTWRWEKSIWMVNVSFGRRGR
jgi:hypothetical protein